MRRMSTSAELRIPGQARVRSSGTAQAGHHALRPHIAAGHRTSPYFGTRHPQQAQASPVAGLCSPLKLLPEPDKLEQYRVRKQARVGGVINEYRLIA
jgi:hypothetical protein